jgi:hypothetical protein
MNYTTDKKKFLDSRKIVGGYMVVYGLLSALLMTADVGHWGMIVYFCVSLFSFKALLKKHGPNLNFKEADQGKGDTDEK